MNIQQKIEAYLFIKEEPVSLQNIAKFFSISTEEAEEGINLLDQELVNRGITLSKHAKGYYLSTHPKVSEIAKSLQKEELSAPLSPATLETFAIILYREGATKSEVDYIRGVNSSQTLRTLLVRGLISKNSHPEDKRTYIYSATPQTLSYLGITTIDNLPNIKEIQQQLNEYEERNTEETEEE